MPFIRMVREDEASLEVRQMYTRYLESLGYIPNYARVFSLHPQVMEAWSNLNKSIRSSLDTRRYELVTLAAARALKSSYCMLAHGSILCEQFFTPEQLTLIARDYHTSDLTRAEELMMAYAEKVVVDATAVTQDDIDELRANGFSDGEIFDITVTATARCFFSKILDALGVQADEHFLTLEAGLREVLTIGRPISRKDLEENQVQE